MMQDAVCNLHTGLQGNGKTLLTLKHVEELRLASGKTEDDRRKVFYSGIRDLTLNWEQFGGPSADPAHKEKPWFTDASEWYKLPTGAIIVIDEAQRLFRPRGNGSAVPAYEAALETLRHNGHTLFLITQDPGLISAGTRKLCGIHRHMMRKFGTNWCTIHEYVGVRDNVAKSRKGSQETNVVYPKEYYDKYKSAEEHNVKARIPWKILALVVVLVGAVGFGFYSAFAPRSGTTAKPSQAPASGAGPSRPLTQEGGGKYVPPQTAQALAASYQPRIQGIPHTAPRYDELTAPVKAPIVVGCWIQAKAATCITQQGTRIKPSIEFAASFIENGQFVDIEDRDSRSEQGGAQQTSAKRGSDSAKGS